LFEGRLGSSGFGDDHDKKSSWDLSDAGLEDFPKAAAHFVSNDSTANAA
jgi:hypothetical protein